MKIKPAGKIGHVTVELDESDEFLMARGDITSNTILPKPFRLKKILVPTDFSTYSDKALEYALAFAERSQAEVILLHVVEPVGYATNAQDIPIFVNREVVQEDVVISSRDRLARMGREKSAGRVPIKTVVRLGNPAGEIVEAAKSLEVDLIILATHGHTGLKHILLGSTAERVVRHGPCPVLTVRAREHEFVS